MIGVVVGLEAEARLARALRGDVEVAVGGGTADGARRAAEHLLQNGAEALISFGLAGGLSPDLRPGALLVPRRVIADGIAFEADRDLAQRLGGATPHDLLHSERIVATARDKAGLFSSTRCAALDMESGALARAALAEARPFAALRAVCDPATRSLPPAALLALSPDGRIRVLRVIGSLLRRPDQIGALGALARDGILARQALRHRVRSIARL